MIRITGPLLIIVVTAVFLFLAATNIQGGWLYLVDALLWTVVLMAVLFPLAQLRQLHISRRFPGQPQAGSPVQVNLNLSTPGRLPLMFINLEDFGPRALRSDEPVPVTDAKTFLTTLKKSEPQQFSYTFTPPVAGLYLFEDLQTGSFGPLGLMGIYRKHKQTSAVLVHPQPPEHLLQIFSAEQEQSLQKARQRAVQNQDVSHFREYQPGDSRRMIHWKNSAKTQRLVVAEAREEPYQAVELWVDTSSSTERACFADIVCTAESICQALIGHQMSLTCQAQTAQAKIWQGFDLPAPQRRLEGVRSWKEISYWLASLHTDAELSLLETLAQQPNSQPQIVIVIAATLEPELLDLFVKRCGPDFPLLVYTQTPLTAPVHLRHQVTCRSLLAVA